MSTNFSEVDASAPRVGRRITIALAVVGASVAAVLSCYAFDILGVFESESSLSCVSLGLAERVCVILGGQHVPKSFILTAVVLGSTIIVGFYDPRPLFLRVEQSRRSIWWLVASGTGTVILVSPYLLGAGDISLSSFGPLANFLAILGATMAVFSFLFWLSDPAQLWATIKPRYVFLVLAFALTITAAGRLIYFPVWSVPAIHTATINTASFFLHLFGQTEFHESEHSVIGTGSFRVVVGPGCSGIEGMIMASAVMVGYILALRNKLNVRRALILIPLAAGLSWMLNGVRIAALLMIGAYLSPELAVQGFHSNAGWVAFCTLTALMLFAAENIRWIHRHATQSVSATPILNDPIVARIAPFIILLVSSLLAGAIFIQPELGYPFRLTLMAVAVFLFWKNYHAEVGPVDALPFFAGVLVALVWLYVKAGQPPLTIADILGTASTGIVALWILFRIFGNVFLVPFIEEMFFRGYLLQRLDFGGKGGSVTALVISSALFGALHSNFWLASASGLVFAFLALRRKRIFDAVAAHSTANGIIAAWAVWTNDWSVI